MKVTLHVPVEQYGFVAADVETDDPNEIRAAYQRIADAFKTGAGVAQKEYNAFIDAMLLGEPNHIDIWEKLSDDQRDAAQVIKRALKRLEAKNKQ